MRARTYLLVRRMVGLFWGVTATALALIAATLVLHRFRVRLEPPLGSEQAWGLALLVLAGLCGIALPVLIRTAFNARVLKHRRVEFSWFQVYEETLVAVPGSAAIFAAAAYLLSVTHWHLYGAAAAGLYGIYNALPTSKKLTSDLQFYGLEE